MRTTISNIDTYSQNFILKPVNEADNSFWKKAPKGLNQKFIFINPIEVLTKLESNTVIQKNTGISNENIINKNRLSTLEQDFTHQLISYITEETFESGMESVSHLMVKKQMKINSSVTKEWLNKIYVDNFQNDEILTGLLRIISRFESEEINPVGQVIAFASLSHKNEIVQETAIRAFECWGGESSLKILENVSVSSKWVEEYLKGVISDLKSEYAY